MVTINTEFGP